MAITDWPAAERPREKLLARGAAALSDAELLAIFLRTGVPGMSAVELARELLAEHGGLAEVLRLDRRTFCSRKGLGEAKYVQLQAALEMAPRHDRCGNISPCGWPTGRTRSSPASIWTRAIG